MAITGGFGKTFDLERGTERAWVMERDGVKRWADTGAPITQDLLNSMMRNPGERQETKTVQLPVCPNCGERYCGDGVQHCTECQAHNAELTRLAEGQSGAAKRSES